MSTISAVQHTDLRGQISLDDLNAIAAACAEAISDFTEFPELNNLFTYHAPTPSQLPRYAILRRLGKALAYHIVLMCPPGADRTAAIRKVREAVMTANAAIACEEPIVNNNEALAAQ